MSKKKTASPPIPVSPPSFEDSLEQLEAIIRKLEGGQLPLDDSLEQYELGIHHLGLCYKTLARVEKKVELLSGLDAQGKPLTVPFNDPEDDTGNNPTADSGEVAQKRASLGQKGAARSRRSSISARKNSPASNSKSSVDEGDTLF